MSGRRSYEPIAFDAEQSAKFAASVLQKANLPITRIAVIGTVASWFSLPRDRQLMTKDLDFAIRQEDTVWIESALRSMQVTPGQIEFGGVKVELLGGINVDFIDRRTELAPLFREALDAAEQTDVRVYLGCTEVLLMPLEYVVAMKIVPARDRDDLVLGHILEAAKDLDYCKARNIVLRHLGPASANRLDAFARRAGRLVSVP